MPCAQKAEGRIAGRAYPTENRLALTGKLQAKACATFLTRQFALYFRQVPAELATHFARVRRWFARALATHHVFAYLLFGWLLQI
ncbi:MAG: hypothetical protein ACI9ZF_000447 [Bradyrhizobium sp.]|jgi:hypothetical protein